MAIFVILVSGGALVMVAALAYGRHASQEAFDRLLIGSANQIATSIKIQNGVVAVDIPVSAFELLALAPEDRVTYRVMAQDGTTITGYDDLAPPPAPAAEIALYPGSFKGEDIRIVAIRRQFSERAFSGVVDVMVGQTMRARRALASDIAGNALIVLGVAGLFMVVLATFAVRSALRPLRRIEHSISARAHWDLTPLDVDVPREIGTLVAVINRFIGRLDKHLSVMRNFIADASHQLRTPIAALRAQAELATEESDPARLRAIVARIHARALGLSRLTDQLLNHALIIHRSDAVLRERLDLRTVAIRTVKESDQEQVSTESVLRLDLTEDAIWVRGDALSLVEACKNLVNNAFRYGKPPVTVSVDHAGGLARLRVVDCGEGFPDEYWSEAGSRFARNAAVGPASAGLGLAIVQAVAEAHGGQLRFQRLSAARFEAALLLPHDAGGGK